MKQINEYHSRILSFSNVLLDRAEIRVSCRRLSARSFVHTIQAEPARPASQPALSSAIENNRARERRLEAECRKVDIDYVKLCSARQDFFTKSAVGDSLSYQKDWFKASYAEKAFNALQTERVRLQSKLEDAHRTLSNLLTLTTKDRQPELVIVERVEKKANG
ncbi:MAG: hypothetical protein ABIH86_03015 [Planctomycetota bacterium]